MYNGGDRKGLAADVGRNLRSKGFRVVLTTNTVEKIQKTVIGADGNNPEVLFVKSFFKEADVRSDRRVDRTVDVLVGNKYRGFNKRPRPPIRWPPIRSACPLRRRARPPLLAADRAQPTRCRNLRDVDLRRSARVATYAKRKEPTCT